MIDRRRFLGSSAGVGAVGLAPGLAAGKTMRTRHSARDLSMWRAEIGNMRNGESRYGNTTRLADVGILSVPRDQFTHGGGGGSSYRIRFARLLGPRGGAAPPVFFFLGGPTHIEDLWWLYDGGGGNRNTFAMVDTILRHTDLVLIDHRGNAGCIYPKIPHNDVTAQLPLDRPLDAAERRAECEHLWRRVIEHQTEAGVDLSTLTTPQLVRDVDAVRQVLGYDKIRLMGISNGTYRAREYLRQFQPHVDSALLFVSHGYEKRPHPNDVRASVERFDAAAAADPVIGRYVPSSLELLLELTRRLDASPQRVPVKSRFGDSIVLSGADLAIYFWETFSKNKELLKFPGRLWKIKQGDYSELASIAAMARTLGEQNNSNMAYAGTAMPSAEQNLRNRQAAGEAYFLNRDLSELIGDTCPFPRDSKTPFELQVPTTYVQGEWDIHTPVEAVRRVGGAHIQVILNPNQGHETTLVVEEQKPPFCFEQAFVENFLTGGVQKPYGQPRNFDRSAFGA